MAQYLYNKFKEEMLTGNDVWNTGGTDVFAVQLCHGTQALVNAADPVVGDIALPATTNGGEIDPQITTPTFVAGVFKGADVTFTSIDGGGSSGDFDQLMVYNETSTRLMALIDINTVGQTGGDIEVQWDTVNTLNNQTGGIFAV